MVAIQRTVPLLTALAALAFGDHYDFLLDGQPFATMDSKLLSTEMAGGFTGVTIGPYCRSGQAIFQGFDYQE
jgi:alpha-N-arabinofuranosidase